MVQMVVTLASWTFVDQSKDFAFIVLLKLCQWYSVVRSTSTSEGELVRTSTLAISLRESIRDAMENSGRVYDTKAIKRT